MAFIRRAHQLLFWGHQAARLKFSSETEEEVISQLIYEAIEKLTGESLELPSEYFRLGVQNESPISSGGRTGKRRKLVDIVLIDYDTRPRYILYCEAKRLYTPPASNLKKYMAEGINRFIDGHYAPDHQYAVMLGYLQSDGPDYWASELKKCLDEPKNIAPRPLSSLTPCHIVDDLPHEWTSRHRRVSGSEIQLYHIFFDCS